MDDKTLKALEILASKLGTTSEFLWAVLVKQAVLSSSIQLAVAAVLFIIGIAAGVWLSKTNPKENQGNPAAFGLCLLSAFIIFVFVFPHHIATLINPEYWALNRIFEVLGN